MVTPQKIEEWLKEVEARPESAKLIVKFIAERLRDLSARNEELLAENIVLQSGERIEEYKKRIEHLEYQLALLKQRYEIVKETSGELQTSPTPPASISLLIYNAKGGVIRLEIDPAEDATAPLQGRYAGALDAADEPPRLLTLPSREEVLLLFTSGRVSTRPVAEIPVALGEADWEWSKAVQEEMHAGERLACLAPVAALPVSDFFLQASRRGCIKKTMMSMSQAILSNHFLGKGIVQKADQAFELTFGRKGELLALLSREGRLLCLDVDELSYAVEERLRLSATDHVIAAFIIHPNDTLLVLTQTGKVLQRASNDLEPARSPLAKGQALIPEARRDQGVRAIGAAPVRESDLVVALHADGKLTRHEAGQLAGAGAVPTDSQLLAFTTYPVLAEGK